MKYHVSFDLDFKRNPYKGTFIAFEGIDGSGKSAQASILSQRFGKKKDIVFTKEPWDEGVIGGFIRNEILSHKTSVAPVGLQYLFCADRADHLARVVEPSLKEGKTVITERYFWSSIPYGLFDVEKDSSNAKHMLLSAYSILSYYHQFMLPDYTFYLSISLDTAMKRLETKEHKELYEKKEKLEKIIKGYEWLTKEFPHEFIEIDGEQPMEKVTEEIISHMSTKL